MSKQGWGSGADLDVLTQMVSSDSTATEDCAVGWAGVGKELNLPLPQLDSDTNSYQKKPATGLHARPGVAAGVSVPGGAGLDSVFLS